MFLAIGFKIADTDNFEGIAVAIFIGALFESRQIRIAQRTILEASRTSKIRDIAAISQCTIQRTTSFIVVSRERSLDLLHRTFRNCP
jgi:hypothetical protein